MSVNESTENQKIACSGLDWSFWQHFEPRWTIEPQVAQWLRGTVDVAVARGVGFFLAAVAGIATAGFGFESILLKQDAIGYLCLTVALTFLILGGFVCQGKRWASLGLMALFTIDRAGGNLMAYKHGSPYYANHLSFWLVASLLGWAVWMRVFYIAFRAEQQRVSKEQTLAFASDAPTSMMQ